MMPGGYSETKPATPQVQQIADEVKSQFENRVNRTYNIFKAIVYRTQVVAGVNYLIKVQDTEDDYVHLKVFQSLPHEQQGPKLVAFETGKRKDDPLIPF